MKNINKREKRLFCTFNFWVSVDGKQRKKKNHKADILRYNNFSTKGKRLKAILKGKKSE